MKKTLIGLLAVALSFTAFSCDFPLTGSTPKESTETTNIERVDLYDVFLRINPLDSQLSQYRITEYLNLLIPWNVQEKDDPNNWHLSFYAHSHAKVQWDLIKDYSLRVLGDKASIEYVEDKRSGLHYDHWHWYVVVNNTRIAEYEKVGGAASAAYDHVRLLKSWWDYKYSVE